MNKFIKQVLLCALIFGSASSYACDDVLSVSREVTVNASSDAVWKLLNDFNGLDKWHPAVAKSTLRGKGTEKGDIRVLTLNDGALIYDELIDHSPISMAYTYKLISSPLPVSDYVGSLKLIKNNQDNSTTIIWSSNFVSDGVSDEEAIELLNGIYDLGLNALDTHFSQ